MRIRAAVGSLLGGVALAFLAATPAFAEDPVDLGSSPVLDAAGVLDDAAAEAAIDAAYERTGVSLFVVVVDSFDDPADADDWTTATAERNGLGVDDVLLAIAVEDRTYSLSADYETLSDPQYDAVLGAIEAELRDDDWDGAVAAAAGTIADQLDPPFPVVPVAIGGGVVAVGGLIAGGVALSRRRRASAAGRASAKELDTRAGSLLVQLDDAVKTSEQELGFAVAQFGDEATAGFREALDAATAQVKEAFAIRHRLDDTQPETPDERRSLTLRIIELCESADDTLDAQDEAFDALRDLEKNAPQLVESVGADQAALAARLDAAEATVADLRSRFGAPAVDAVDENPAQARKLAAVAASSLATAREALSAGEAGRAAVAVRTAQQSVGQAQQLLAAVDAAATELPALGERLAAAIADTRADVAEARAVDGTALDAVITEAEGAIAAAAGQDPATALAAVEAVNAALARELSAVRDRQAQVARAAAQLDRVTAEARAAVDSADGYLTTRRGAVGASARARLSEARSQLEQAVALGTSDAVAALTAAQNASRLAGSALSLARSEVAAFDAPSRPSFGPDGEDWGGAILGGILDSLFSGSGSGSGSSWGSSSGWSGSRRRSSSWGGFGGSSRRSSGSSRRSSSSGGRRSRGGRF
jgi:hypothetical protein